MRNRGEVVHGGPKEPIPEAEQGKLMLQGLFKDAVTHMGHLMNKAVGTDWN